MFAAIVTGEENKACCQPWVDSPVTVAVASRVPEAFHSDTVWVPPLPAPL